MQLSKIFNDKLKGPCDKILHKCKKFAESVFTHEHPQEKFWESNHYAALVINSAINIDINQIERIISQRKISLNTQVTGDQLAYRIGFSLAKKNIKDISVFTEHKIFKKHILQLAAGQAQAGNINRSEQLRKKYSLPAQEIAKAAARSSRYAYVKFLSEKSEICNNSILQSAARAGDFDYCFRKYTDRGAINAIAQGAAIGGWYKEAESIREEYGVEVDIIAKAAALGGWLEYAELLHHKHGANIYNISEYAALGGHLRQADEMQTKYNVPASKIVSAAAQGGHHLYCLYQLNYMPDMLDTIAKTSAEYGYLEFCEFLRVQYDASTSELSHGAMLGGYKKYARFLHDEHQADITKIATAATIKNDKEEVIQALNIGADATTVLTHALTHDKEAIVKDIILRKAYKIEALQIACMAVTKKYYTLVEQMISMYNLDVNTLAEHAFSTKANEFVEMLREEGYITTITCAERALRYDNYDYLEYLKAINLLPKMILGEAAVKEGKIEFAEMNYQSLKNNGLQEAKVYLDYMLIGAVKAKNENYIVELLSRGASKALASYTAMRTGSSELVQSLTAFNKNNNSAHLWVASCAHGQSEQRTQLAKTFYSLEKVV